MRQLATTSSDKTIKLWNLDGFSLDRTLTGEDARCLIACGHAACKGMCMPHGRSLEASLMHQTDLLSGLLHSRWKSVSCCVGLQRLLVFPCLIVCPHRCNICTPCESACLVQQCIRCSYGDVQGTSAGCGIVSFQWMQLIL